MSSLTTASGQGLEVFRRGKVRDTFDLGDGTLLMVATDRISAFDVVLPTSIPGKGIVLTQMSRWWFDQTAHLVPNHLRPDSPESLPAAVEWDAWAARAMRVAKADRIDIECVVRGYLAGSGYSEYKKQGTLASEVLPAGLQESSRLPEWRFTPAMKNDDGHDENISRAQLADVVGQDLAARLEALSLTLFDFAATHCAERGIILADTKFEFGWIDGDLCLIDEIFTPDSSRFWDQATWAPGATAPSFDKQPVRDWLENCGWDKTPPGPELPADVVAGTTARYREAAHRICGLDVS